MSDEFLRIGGRSDSGVAKALRTDENGNVGVQTAGKRIEITTLVDELEITDTITNTVNISPTTLEKYSEWDIFIRNAADKKIYLGFSSMRIIKTNGTVESLSLTSEASLHLEIPSYGISFIPLSLLPFVKSGVIQTDIKDHKQLTMLHGSVTTGANLVFEYKFFEVPSVGGKVSVILQGKF